MTRIRNLSLAEWLESIAHEYFSPDPNKFDFPQLNRTIAERVKFNKGDEVYKEALRNLSEPRVQKFRDQLTQLSPELLDRYRVESLAREIQRRYQNRRLVEDDTAKDKLDMWYMLRDFIQEERYRNHLRRKGQVAHAMAAALVFQQLQSELLSNEMLVRSLAGMGFVPTERGMGMSRMISPTTQIDRITQDRVMQSYQRAENNVGGPSKKSKGS